MLPSRSLPPVVCCLGTNPIQAARLRPERNSLQSPTSATSAVATIGPMPGISSRRRLASHERCQVRILLSIDLISAADISVCRSEFTFLWPPFSHAACRPCILGQIQIGFVLQCFVALPAWCTLDDLADATGDLADATPACSSLASRVLLFGP